LTELRVQHVGDRVRFAVRVQPRASRSEIGGLQGDALRVRITARPVDGAANRALVELIASVLHVPARNVRIVAGASARSKLVEVAGIAATDVRALVKREPGAGV
jgi:uncharacterized protein (TIGR00251 family)